MDDKWQDQKKMRIKVWVASELISQLTSDPIFDINLSADRLHFTRVHADSSTVRVTLRWGGSISLTEALVSEAASLTPIINDGKTIFLKGD